jgi:hypothetical protein
VLDLLWAKDILFCAAGANRPNSGNRIAIDQSFLRAIFFVVSEDRPVDCHRLSHDAELNEGAEFANHM